MLITEELRCPLTGDVPDERIPHPIDLQGFRILIPGKHLPPTTTDAQAEHERAMMRAPKWSRQESGVVIWVDM